MNRLAIVVLIAALLGQTAYPQYEEAERTARQVLADFFEAFNAADNEALQKLANYPHVFLLDNGRMNIANGPSELVTNFEAMREREGWRRSTLDSAEICQISEEKVHFNVVFSRYDADGVKYRTVPALWIVTKQDGHWGLQVRSLLPATYTISAREPFFEKSFTLGAHRGGMGWRPESTLKTFREAVECWPDIMLETDARVTKDGVAVLLHDAAVDRTANGTGPIAEMTLAEVQALDAGYRWTNDGGKTFPYRGQGHRITTLQEALEALPNTRFLVELKDTPGVARAVVDAVRAANAMDRVLIASFNPDYMEEAKALEPRLLTCFDRRTQERLVASLRGESWGGYVPEDDVLILDFYRLENYGITTDDFPAINSKGIPICAYTINTVDEMRRVLNLGAKSILTDRPDILAEVLGEGEGR